ncbi:hypothetical protein [Bradyrhizobium sp. PRIMUS42]|uniref:ATP-dependent DNA ligase n=1 Tax=Bradyrhizobium sp. PRIMUS42 TaxID=2908926 RepID=UPI001FF324DC|nr:hypothetical protein [Bradyrhizobium sp. PRIMUS42]MCJ9729539.1 hypothetical protein [Bradyrhizobium sp. PRIMUS42]
MLKNRQKRFVIDGEAVILGVDGVSDFNALHSRKHDHEAQLYAFDILAMGGDDVGALPLHLRKTNLERLLARRPDGIIMAPFEGEIVPDLFRAACFRGPARGPANIAPLTPAEQNEQSYVEGSSGTRRARLIGSDRSSAVTRAMPMMFAAF